MEVTAYNLDKLDANGNHYVAIGFSLPYCLHVPDENFKVRVEISEEIIEVQLIFEKRHRGRGDLLSGSSEIEKFADRRGNHCFSSVLAYVPVRGQERATHSHYDQMWSIVERRKIWFRELAITAINQFVSMYRYSTGECHIQPLKGHDVWFDFSFAFFFNELPPEAKQSKFRADVLPIYNLHNLVSSVPNLPEEVLTDIRAKLIQNFQIPLAEELLLNSYDYLDQGNARLALIEAETGFEAALYSLLRDHYNGKPVKTNFPSPDDMIKSKQFQTALRTIGKEFSKSNGRYVEWHEHVWRVRGGIVHGRIRDISIDTASRAIRIVEEILEYLTNRLPTRPWRYV